MSTDFIGLFALLAAAQVRFVLVGVLALVLHGLDRLAADVDLVIDLSAESAQAAAPAFTEAGYRPPAPVDAIALADPAQRREWQVVRHMQVLGKGAGVAVALLGDHAHRHYRSLERNCNTGTFLQPSRSAWP